MGVRAAPNLFTYACTVSKGRTTTPVIFDGTRVERVDGRMPIASLATYAQRLQRTRVVVFVVFIALFASIRIPADIIYNAIIRRIFMNLKMQKCKKCA